MEKLIGFNPPQKLIGSGPTSLTIPDPKDAKCPKGIKRAEHPSNREQDTNELPAVPPPMPASSSGHTSETGSDSESEDRKSEEELGWKFHRTFINKETGMGLIAGEFIPTGSIIYADRLIWMTKAEEETHRTTYEADSLLGHKVAAMGRQWHQAYMDMPNTRQEELGAMGGIWDTFQLPMYWDGELGSVLGLNLAFTNHSCVPNAAMTLVNDYPDEGGRWLMHKKPRLAGAMARSFVDIFKGQEITIAYFYSKGEADYRRLCTLDVLGFRCACRYCLHPNADVEDALGTHYRLEHILNNANVVHHKPAMAYQMAHEITVKLNECGIGDPRAAMIWAKCALIAAFHSDIGRIRCFLVMILRLTEGLQGPTGPLFRRAIKWFESMSVMPGFGSSTRGLSSMKDAHVFLENRPETRPLLFMLGAKPDEYIRMNRWRRVPDSDGERRFEIDQEPERHHHQPKRAKTRKKEPNNPRREKCNDPEKDFLALWLRVVSDFIDHGSHEPNATKKTGKTKKNISEESSSMEKNRHDHHNHIHKYTVARESEQKQPVVRDAGVKRKVVMQHVSLPIKALRETP